ncbi:MAG: DUF4340 domain-containing protein [Rickettsiales bacterium]|nr:DUF4340 domain-containing protein [Rickettsiales bacterium]
MARMNRTPLLLSLITLGLVLTGWSLVQSNQAQWEAKTQGLVFPALKKSLGELTELTLSAGGEKLTLMRGKNKQWVLPQKSNYPVDMGRFRELLRQLSASRLLEQKTARAENHAQLGLDQEHATHIRLLAGKTVVADALIGRLSERRQATYLRFASQDQTWTMDTPLSLQTKATFWVRQEVLDVAPDRIQRVTIQQGSQPALHVERRSKNEPFQLIPAMKETNDSITYQLSTTPRLFSHLMLTDVIPAADVLASSADVTRMETFDGLVLSFRFNGEGELATDRWVVVTATTTDGAAEPVTQEAAAINARTEGWAYHFAPYLMTQLRLTHDVLKNYKGPLPVK